MARPILRASSRLSHAFGSKLICTPGHREVTIDDSAVIHGYVYIVLVFRDLGILLRSVKREAKLVEFQAAQHVSWKS
jgi:hypothetical protein